MDEPSGPRQSLKELRGFRLGLSAGAAKPGGTQVIVDSAPKAARFCPDHPDGCDHTDQNQGQHDRVFNGRRSLIVVEQSEEPFYHGARLVEVVNRVQFSARDHTLAAQPYH